MAYIVFFAGRERKEVKLEQRDSTVGRSRRCSIVLEEDIEVSRLHCTIQRQEDGSYLLIDEEARNGTYLNAKRIMAAEEHTLKDGDEILVGTTRFRFYQDDEKPPKVKAKSNDIP